MDDSNGYNVPIKVSADCREHSIGRIIHESPQPSTLVATSVQLTSSTQDTDCVISLRRDPSSDWQTIATLTPRHTYAKFNEVFHLDSVSINCCA